MDVTDVQCHSEHAENADDALESDDACRNQPSTSDDKKQTVETVFLWCMKASKQIINSSSLFLQGTACTGKCAFAHFLQNELKRSQIQYENLLKENKSLKDKLKAGKSMNGELLKCSSQIGIHFPIILRDLLPFLLLFQLNVMRLPKK